MSLFSQVDYRSTVVLGLRILMGLSSGYSERGCRSFSLVAALFPVADSSDGFQSGDWVNRGSLSGDHTVVCLSVWFPPTLPGTELAELADLPVSNCQGCRP